MTLIKNYCLLQKHWENYFEKYKQRKLSFNKQHETLDNEKESNIFIGISILDHLAFNVFIFVMAVISVIIVFIMINLIFKREKMQALVTNLAMIKGVRAINEEIKNDINKEYWIIIIWLSLILLGVLFLNIEKLYRMPIFRTYHYSNAIKIMIFLSDIKSYVPIKL